MNPTGQSLFTRPIHLGLGATAIAQPAMTGMEFYADYSARTASDGAEGRLVSMYRFDENWDSWEVHPSGDEVVLLIEGSMTLLQEMPDGSVVATILRCGDYAINAPGIWHTVDVTEPATVLFITAGLGTTHRPR